MLTHITMSRNYNNIIVTILMLLKVLVAGGILSSTLSSSSSTLDSFIQVGQNLYGSPPAHSGTDTEYGTTVILSSNDGSRLIVGATRHDWTTSHGQEIDGRSSMYVNNCGGIYLYERNIVASNTKGKTRAAKHSDNDWKLIWFVSGNVANEEIGDRIAMSADGKRIALRRHSNSHHVEVYDINHMGQVKRVGEWKITSSKRKTRDGNTISLSPGGNRLAISTETYYNYTGLVDIYEYNNVKESWELIGTLDGPKLGYDMQDRFGWATRFDSNGDRIVISALNYDGNGIPQCGMIRAFDYDGVSDWRQVGNDILGYDGNGRLGTSLDLSSDGSTVVAGSPYSNTFGPGRGIVVVYKLTNNNWKPHGNIISGIENNDRFGRSVSISNDGKRIVASSSDHNVQRGHIRVFDLHEDDSMWIQVGTDIQGLGEKDRLGFGYFGVSMTGDGRRIATGSPLGRNPSVSNNSTGRVRVFDRILGRNISSSVVPNSTFLDLPTSTNDTSDITLSGRPSETVVVSALPTSLPSDSLSEQNISSGNSTGNNGSTIKRYSSDPAIPPPTTEASPHPIIEPTPLPSDYPTTRITSRFPTPWICSFDDELVDPVITYNRSEFISCNRYRNYFSVENYREFPSYLFNPSPELPPCGSKTDASRSFIEVYDGSLYKYIFGYCALKEFPNEIFVTLDGNEEYAIYMTLSDRLCERTYTSNAILIPKQIEVANEKFSWDLQYFDQTIQFDLNTRNNQVILYYNISRRDTMVGVYEEDCTTAVPTSVINVRKAVRPSSGVDATLLVEVNIKQDDILGSDIWARNASMSCMCEEDGRSIAHISFCVRVDLLLNNKAKTSVVYDEHLFHIDIELWRGFYISGIRADWPRDRRTIRLNLTDHNITAYQCDVNGTETNTSLYQVSDVFVCVETNSRGSRLTSIEELIFSKGGGFQTQVINGGGANDLTDYYCVEQLCMIRTQLVSAFFDGNVDPGAIDVFGTVKLACGSADCDEGTNNTKGFHLILN